MLRLIMLLTAALGCAGMQRVHAEVVLDDALAARFARLALDCVGLEYPNKITHELRGDQDVAPPRTLYPAFHGCFDWHSSVHGHWLLVRLLRNDPHAEFATEARAALARNLTPATSLLKSRQCAAAAIPSSDRTDLLAAPARRGPAALGRPASARVGAGIGTT